MWLLGYREGEGRWGQCLTLSRLYKQSVSGLQLQQFYLFTLKQYIVRRQCYNQFDNDRARDELSKKIKVDGKYTCNYI